MGMPVVVFAPNLLSSMGGIACLVRQRPSLHSRSCSAAAFRVMLLFLNNAIFRGAGDASIAMRVLWVSNLINLALDPCFIFGLGPFPALGVTGAAVLRSSAAPAEFCISSGF